jgi:hypothetical protein
MGTQLSVLNKYTLDTFKNFLLHKLIVQRSFIVIFIFINIMYFDQTQSTLPFPNPYHLSPFLNNFSEFYSVIFTHIHTHTNTYTMYFKHIHTLLSPAPLADFPPSNIPLVLSCHSIMSRLQVRVKMQCFLYELGLSHSTWWSPVPSIFLQWTIIHCWYIILVDWLWCQRSVKGRCSEPNFSLWTLLWFIKEVGCNKTSQNSKVNYF